MAPITTNPPRVIINHPLHRNGLGRPDIHYSLEPSPFGSTLIASTAGEICMLAFADSVTEQKVVINRLRTTYPERQLQPASDESHRFAAAILRGEHGGSDGSETGSEGDPLRLNLKGTPFQMNVWRALLQIPPGSRSTYSAIAREIGQPKAVRAVGTAIGRNPIAILIPCHRVVRTTGELGGYHWGVERKRAILQWEATHLSASVEV